MARLWSHTLPRLTWVTAHCCCEPLQTTIGTNFLPWLVLPSNPKAVLGALLLCGSVLALQVFPSLPCLVVVVVLVIVVAAAAAAAAVVFCFLLLLPP